MTVTNFFDAQFGMIQYPLCGNYDDGDHEDGCADYEPEEDLEMMYPDEGDQAELHEDDW